QNRMVRCAASVRYSPSGPHACKAAFMPSAGAIAGHAGGAPDARFAGTRLVSTVTLFDIFITPNMESFAVVRQFDIVFRLGRSYARSTTRLLKNARAHELLFVIRCVRFIQCA